jgi:hypothetical protein
MPRDASALEKVLLQGDLSSLKTDERIQYYRELCASLDLNPLTKPFEYLEMKGQGGKNILTLYVRKDCADQLRNKRNASTAVVSRETLDGVYIVTVRVTTPEGRSQESIGAVPIMKEGGRWRTNEDGRKEFQSDGTFIPLRPEERANAYMRAQTKAERRATLALFGLGFAMDESELDTVRGKTVTVEDAHSGKLLNAAPEPAPQAKLDPRPIPDELFDAVTKLRAGDASVIKTATAFLKGEIEQACGTDGPFLKETEGIRKRYPKTNGKETIPPEEMVGMWLDLWAIIESGKFANEVNPA